MDQWGGDSNIKWTNYKVEDNIKSVQSTNYFFIRKEHIDVFHTDSCEGCETIVVHLNVDHSTFEGWQYHMATSNSQDLKLIHQHNTDIIRWWLLDYKKHCLHQSGNVHKIQNT